MPDLAKRVRSGGCQCGALRYALRSEPTHTSICWCRMCQKASGNYFQAFTGVPRADFVWTRGQPGTFHSSAAVARESVAHRSRTGALRSIASPSP
jgi:hypothetical protein